MRKAQIFMNEPVYLGLSILEISKLAIPIMLHVLQST